MSLSAAHVFDRLAAGFLKLSWVKVLETFTKFIPSAASMGSLVRRAEMWWRRNKRKVCG